jgi:hypothetical protein
MDPFTGPDISLPANVIEVSSGGEDENEDMEEDHGDESYEGNQAEEVEEEDENDESFTTKLQEFLDEVLYDGTFSSFHTHNTYANPGLYLNGYGSVGLPLATRDAKGITEICKQAPFGKGDETLVDTSVRNTWELDTKDFECRNPA